MLQSISQKVLYTEFSFYVMHVIFIRIAKYLLWIPSLFLRPIVYLLNVRGKKTVTPITDPLLKISATNLAKKIRERELKSEDVIKAYIARCKEVNPIINAVVEPRYEVALTEAKNIDQMIASESHSVEQLKKMYPLLGVPVTVKESIAVSGMSNEAGRIRSKRIPAIKDAECIAQVRAAGAIPILVSNTPELCMCWETYNYVTGTTKNPFDTRRTPGGSSGGEAALISSGASVIGVGSDIAGSLRLPAMYTGIFGHKPTPRSVSLEGHMPTCEDEDWNEVFNLGPMARYAEDLPLLFNVLKKSSSPKTPVNEEVAVENLRYYYMEHDGSGAANNLSREMREALGRVVRHFESKNLKVQKAKIKRFKYSFEISIINLLKLDGVETVLSKAGKPGEWRSVTLELFKKIFGCSKYTLCSIMYCVMKKLSNILPRQKFEEAKEINDLIRKDFTDLLKNDGILFYPTHVKNASFHYDFLNHLMDYSYLFVFNCIGLPVVNCPVGIAANGLPIGIQVIASPGCDHLIFAVAKEIEKAFGGWIPPPYNAR